MPDRRRSLRGANCGREDWVVGAFLDAFRFVFTGVLYFWGAAVAILIGFIVFSISMNLVARVFGVNNDR
jgi:uncharacterized membrane protein